LYKSCPDGSHDRDPCPGDPGQCDETDPRVVEYTVRHGGNKTNEDFKLRNPIPDDSNWNGDEGIQGTVLDMVAGLNPYANAGIQIFEYFADNLLGPVSVGTSGTGPDEQKSITWNIDMGGAGESAYPDSPCKSTGVAYDIEQNTESPGDILYIDTFTRYTIAIGVYGRDQSYCPCTAQNTIVLKDTSYAYTPSDFKSVQ
jgi:hypothetical protein